MQQLAQTIIAGAGVTGAELVTRSARERGVAFESGVDAWRERHQDQEKTD
jgi:hypothetical protein